jgi:hypothetical protein
MSVCKRTGWVIGDKAYSAYISIKYTKKRGKLIVLSNWAENLGVRWFGLGWLGRGDRKEFRNQNKKPESLVVFASGY